LGLAGGVTILQIHGLGLHNIQSFQSVLLNFHAMTYLLSDRPEARHAIENVIAQARHAITEGRNAVEGLRSSKHEGSNLEAALSGFGRELAANQPEPSPDFDINVQGTTRSLAPIVATELYYIATEALRNAFQHAQARRIEVEIWYHPREFRLRFRDDGRGIDPKVLQAGRVGHYGITSMRERTRLAGGRLVFWSELNSGAEIELTVPAALALREGLGAGFAHACRKDTQDTFMISSIRILGVDDHALLRKGIAAILASQPDMSLVAEASNGREGVDQHRTHRPDITLMDLQMPEMNGLDAMIAIRGEFPDARIIILAT
jgi:hypothetical protein